MKPITSKSESKIDSKELKFVEFMMPVQVNFALRHSLDYKKDECSLLLMDQFVNVKHKDTVYLIPLTNVRSMVVV